MNIYIFILIIGLFGFKEAFSVQSFDKEPKDTEVNPQEDVVLDCAILNKKGVCSWQKNNKPLAIVPKKYEWAGNQELGNCSLWVRKAVAEFDEGEWECQVTASDLYTQDALTSHPMRLIVRAPPREPRIENNGSQVVPNHNVTVRSDDKVVLKCVSRYGNPPAKLKWFLGDEEIIARSKQTDVPEEDNRRTFMAMSTLELYVNKSHHGRIIRCVAIHESYPSKSQAVDVRLDITYPPEVTLIGVPHQDIEEGQDTVTLRCIADANPAASIIWQRQGSRDVVSISETLIFKPVNQRDSGTYTCTAKNSVGTSQPISATLDVKYGPIIKSVGPDKLTTATLYSSTSFACSADGNPPPKYQWLQRVSNLNGGPHETVILRSTDPKLHFINITYDFQGKYVCLVTNMIGDSERKMESQSITLQVIGAPQIIRQQSEKYEVVAHRGEDAMLSVKVCADPRPKRTVWEWGSLQLEAGAGIGRYKADELLQGTKEDCYVAHFHVNRVDHADARNYYLIVENERGLDKHSIYLAVRGSYTEPLGMSAVFTVAVGSLGVFMICILLAVYIIKSHKCCFRRNKSRRGDFKSADTESCNNVNEKSEISATNGHKPPKIEPMMDNGLNNDLLYCTSPTRRPPPPHTITAIGCSPDAMKKKRRTIYESEISMPDCIQPVKSRSESRSSMFRVEQQSEDSSQQTGSRYRKKSASSKRAKNKRNTFSELQIPTVSDNGATRNRMASYNRQIIVHSDMQSYSMMDERDLSTEYFCPQLPQKTYNDPYDYQDRGNSLLYDNMRTFRQGYLKKDVI